MYFCQNIDRKKSKQLVDLYYWYLYNLYDPDLSNHWFSCHRFSSRTLIFETLRSDSVRIQNVLGNVSLQDLCKYSSKRFYESRNWWYWSEGVVVSLYRRRTHYIKFSKPLLGRLRFYRRVSNNVTPLKIVMWDVSWTFISCSPGMYK